MAREVHPAEVGWADRVSPSVRNPPRALFFRRDGGEDAVELGAAAELIARQPDGLFFADLHAPQDPELDLLGRQFGLHPLAIEDVRHRHQRPKIDVYPGHYFLVLYRIRPGADERPILEEVDVFIGARFLVLAHDTVVPLLDEVIERFRAQSGPRSVSSLLYELLDAIVDEYFPMLDSLTNRSEELEQEVFHAFARERLQALLELKKDLALLRRVVAPERDSINVLLRRDPPILDAEHVFYFQDVYDHLIRITDSIDTDRELVTTSLDAFLSVENNRLSEIVRRLTVISTIFLPLNFVTGFFGMNFARLAGASDRVFVVALLSMVVLPIAMLWLIRRQKTG